MDNSEQKVTLGTLVNHAVAHRLPRLWGRYWGARLMATTHYSRYLSAKTPDIKGWLKVRRNVLTLLLMAKPGPLPVRPQFSRSPSDDDRSQQ